MALGRKAVHDAANRTKAGVGAMSIRRILVDGHVFDGHFQGTRTYLAGLYRALSEMGGYHIQIAMENRDVFDREFGNCRCVEHIPLAAKGTVTRLFAQYPRLIKSLRPDLSHFQYVGPVPCPGRLMITTHDLLFLDFPKQFPLGYRLARTWAFQHFARRADILLTVSDYSKRQISSRFNIPSSKIGLVRNALSDDFFLQTNRNECIKEISSRFCVADFVLFVGRVEPRKNHALLVRAMRESGAFEQGKALVFLGKRDLTANDLEAEIADVPVEWRSRIHFLENIGNDDLRKFYAACSVFVFPSLGEGFGIPVLEAAASGAPVICSNATAMGEFPFPDHCFFDPGSNEDLSKKLARALIEPNAFKVDLAQIEMYRWSKSAKDLSEILELGQ